jgi:hypothetical protein
MDELFKDTPQTDRVELSAHDIIVNYSLQVGTMALIASLLCSTIIISYVNLLSLNS